MLIARCLLAALGMLWSIFWALVFGFAASGMIIAFAPRPRLSSLLGRPSLKSLGLATFLGAASSSCSYAAASMARSLHRRGAHIISALAFMLASTNLVVELSAALWVLLGWQFVLAECIGGLLMIVIMTGLMKAFAPLADFERLQEGSREDEETEGEAHADFLTLEGWRTAGRAFRSECRMLWKDIALGMLLSGALMTVVPISAWNSLFLGGSAHSAGRLFENVLLAPLVAVLSFVCSVGNIPMAAMLYRDGIGFGGTLTFIYSDLIIFPLILIYRKYFGGRLALWIVGILYASMVLAGLAVDLVFGALGLVPPPPLDHSGVHRAALLAIDSTFWLNLAAILVGGALLWLARGERAEEDGHCHHH